MMSKESIAKLSYLIGSYSLIIYIVASFIILTAVSFIVKDIDYPKRHPEKFIIETIIMTFIATFPYTYIHWSRNGGRYQKYILSHGLIMLKFGVLHLLLQFSGFYTRLFAYMS